MVVPLAVGIALWIAPQAGATITSSQITSPSGLTYSIFDLENPSALAVSGTTDSDAPASDHVDLRCFYGSTPSSRTLVPNVPLETDGTFSVPTAPLPNVQNQVCRLRAVPSGTTPADLSPFAGPVLATGQRRTSRLIIGPNAGKPFEYYVYAQQLTAADEYDSVGACGLRSGYLFDSYMEQTTRTWACNDWYSWFENKNGPPSSTRSQIQVDGADALDVYSAQSVNPLATSGFPALTYDYALDPATGNLAITESEPIVKCPDATYPPDETKCPSFVDTGVRIDRTISQESDGHLVFFTDKWVSTDGQQHAIDLLPENKQCLAESSCNGSDVQYKFPGEVSYSSHAQDDVVPFSDSAPAAVYVKVDGAPDGEQTTGQGAIVFDRPASPATFNLVDAIDSRFYFHQAGTVPAGGHTTFRFAYAQDYLAANVQSLAQTAINRFSPSPPPPPGGGPAPTPGHVTPHTGKRKRALRKCKKKHKKAWKKKKRHHKLNKHAKKHLKKKFKKCKRKARRLPA